MEFGFLILEVLNIEKMRDWYVEVFQGTVVYTDDGWEEIALGTADDVRLVLSEVGAQDVGGRRHWVPSFQVDGVEMVCERLRTADLIGHNGVKRATRSDGSAYQWSTIHDPEQNAVILYEWLERG